MISFFARALLRKRYARTWLGITWLFLRPGLLIASQVVLFTFVVPVNSGDRPYLILFVGGYLGWALFNATAYWSTRSLELSRSAISRLPLARLIVLLASAWPGVVELLIFAGVFVGIALFYLVADGTTYVSLGLTTLGIIPALLMLLGLGLTIGLWLSPPAMKKRDVRFALGFALQLLYVATPVIYPLSEAPDSLKAGIEFNPLTLPVQMLRLGLFGEGELPLTSVLSTMVCLSLLGAYGLRMFCAAERRAGESI